MRDPSILTPAERSALNALRVYTAGRYDIYALAGGARASVRAAIMSHFDGKRVPQAKAGVTALKLRFWGIAGVTGNCEAVREAAFVAWAKQVAA